MNHHCPLETLLPFLSYKRNPKLKEQLKSTIFRETALVQYWLSICPCVPVDEASNVKHTVKNSASHKVGAYTHTSSGSDTHTSSGSDHTYAVKRTI